MTAKVVNFKMSLDIGIVLFNRGAGGNFLARVLTLDPTTVCISEKNIKETVERYRLYLYENIQLLPSEFSKLGSNGLSKWVNHELFEMYFPFSKGFENLLALNLKVIEPMHPDQLSDKLNLLGPNDRIKIAIINNNELDWTYQQALYKIDKNIKRQNFNKKISIENLIIDEYKKTHQCCLINLSDIIRCDTTFLDSYHKLCDFFNIEFYDEYALDIRRSWKNTWSPTTG